MSTSWMEDEEEGKGGEGRGGSVICRSGRMSGSELSSVEREPTETTCHNPTEFSGYCGRGGLVLCSDPGSD